MRTVAHISDLHFGAIDEPVAASLVLYLAALGADVTVVSGDFTQRATARQYADAMAWVGRLPGPKLFVAGNHDVPMWALWERFAAPFRRYRRHVTREMSPVYEDDGVLILGVTTPRAFVWVRDGFWKDGRITARQLAHLTKRSSREYIKPCLVVTHHPFIPAPGTRRGGVVLGGRAVMPLLAASKVDVLLAGHLHASYHDEIPVDLGSPSRESHSVLSVQAGTATSTRRRHRPDGTEYPNAFNLLRVTAGRVVVEVHTYTNGKWGQDSTSTYQRLGGRWCEVTKQSQGL